MDYEQVEKKLLKIINSTKVCVLATSNKDGIVQASQVCIVNYGLTVYFQTDNYFEKVNNIKENPNVALNLGAYCFKGLATIEGHPNKNAKFIKKYKNIHSKSYNSYTNLPNEVLIKVDLIEAKIWNISYEDNSEKIIVVNLKTKQIKEINCDKCN